MGDEEVADETTEALRKAYDEAGVALHREALNELSHLEVEQRELDQRSRAVRKRRSELEELVKRLEARSTEDKT